MAELVKKLGIHRESGWVYFVDADGDVSRGRVGAIVSYNPLEYKTPEKVKKVRIVRESGYLYKIDDLGNVVREQLPNKHYNFHYLDYLSNNNLWPLNYWKKITIKHGTPSHADEQKEVYGELRDLCSLNGKLISGVYLYKKEDHVLYVGKAVSLYDRTKQHYLESFNEGKKAKAWFDFFHKYDGELELYIYPISHEKDRRAIERMLEAELNPLFEEFRKRKEYRRKTISK